MTPVHHSSALSSVYPSYLLLAKYVAFSLMGLRTAHHPWKLAIYLAARSLKAVGREDRICNGYNSFKKHLIKLIPIAKNHQFSLVLIYIHIEITACSPKIIAIRRDLCINLALISNQIAEPFYIEHKTLFITCLNFLFYSFCFFLCHLLT